MTVSVLLDYLTDQGTARRLTLRPGTTWAVAVSAIEVAESQRPSDTFLRARWKKGVGGAMTDVFRSYCTRLLSASRPTFATSPIPTVIPRVAPRWVAAAFDAALAKAAPGGRIEISGAKAEAYDALSPRRERAAEGGGIGGEVPDNRVRNRLN